MTDTSATTHPASDHAGLHPIRALMDWFSRRRDTLLDQMEARRIAEDLGISVDDLMRLSQEPNDQADLMTRMMNLHGLDRDKLEDQYGAVVRDMAMTCGRCGNKAECRHDLATGQALESFDEFCANAEVIRSFAKEASE